MKSPEMKSAKYVVLCSALLVACASGPSMDAALQAEMAAADELAASEAEALQRDYDAGRRYFESGRVERALVEFDYAAYSGSNAAAARLCAIYGEGLGIKVDPVKGVFWCQRAARAGHAQAGPRARQLFQTWWQEEDV